jgi:hypothetical protein
MEDLHNITSSPKFDPYTNEKIEVKTEVIAVDNTMSLSTPENENKEENQENLGKKPRKKRKIKYSRRWKKKFLNTLARCGSVARSARLSGITKGTVYNLLKKDKRFREKFEEAKAIANDLIEQEMRRRAIDGIEKQVYTKNHQPAGYWVLDGKVVDSSTPEARWIPIIIREYSDSLLAKLADGAFPMKYKKNDSITVNTNVANANIEVSPQMLALERLLREKNIGVEDLKRYLEENKKDEGENGVVVVRV